MAETGTHAGALEDWRQAAPVPLDRGGEDFEVVAQSVLPHAAKLSESERGELSRILHWDIISEFDARFFSAYVRELDLEFSPEFREMERQWARDEARHFAGFSRTAELNLDMDLEHLKDRKANFAPLAHLFGEEFTIVLMGAYDELVTVRAYRSHLEHYARLGTPFMRFVRSVIAEEGRHYGGFMRVIRARHSHRLADVPDVLKRIRATEGLPYQATFFFDHDDSVFDEWMYDEAAELLLRQTQNN
ncbi:MAG: ferritin family protein [Planctomycetota bacterium]|jgi:hypothetical protein